MTTYGYDTNRDNTYSGETVLKPNNVSSLSSTPSSDLMGAVYAQPLYVSEVNIHGVDMDGLFVATEEDYVYGLDADTLDIEWSLDLKQTGEYPVTDAQLPMTCPNIFPEVGITGTPVIDLASGSTLYPGVLYAVSKVYNGTGYAQYLNSIKVGTGAVVFPRFDIGASMTSVGFDALVENQRAGLALGHDSSGNPLIYVEWGSHCDANMNTSKYKGKMAVFTVNSGGTALMLVSAFNVTNGAVDTKGGIWMSGAAPAIDDQGASPSHDLFLAAGNGPFKYSIQSFGESVLRVNLNSSNVLNVAGFYTPLQWSILNGGSVGCPPLEELNIPAPGSGTVCGPADWDLGSGGVILLRPAGTGFLPPTDNFLALAGGKEGVFYNLKPSVMLTNTTTDDGDACGTLAYQCFAAISLPSPLGMGDTGNRGSAAFWNGNTSGIAQNTLYVAGSADTNIRAYSMKASGNGVFDTNYAGIASPPDGGSVLKYPGMCPVVTWNTAGGSTAADNALLWILDTSGGPALTISKLYAYAAKPDSLRNLNQKFADILHGPIATKFMVPTVINDHVYVAGISSASTCTSTPVTCKGKVVVWH